MRYTHFGPPLTKVVQVLIIVQVALYVMALLTQFSLTNKNWIDSQFVQIFGLTDRGVLSGKIWQIATYHFLHYLSPFGILFNMLTLWMFGSELEEKWGARQFLKYYLYCGTGAGFLSFLLPVLFASGSGTFLGEGITVLGPTGTLLGLLLAYALYWPDRQVLFMFIFPLKVKYLVVIFVLIIFTSSFMSNRPWGLTNLGQIGGLITGYLYFLYFVNTSTTKYVEDTQKWNVYKRYKLGKQRKLWEKRQSELYDLENMSEKVDYLLDKINKTGYKSLSSSEKKFLKRASQNMNAGNETKH